MNRVGLGDESRVLLRWLIAEKSVAISNICSLLGYKERQVRKLLSGEATIDLVRLDKLVEAIVSPWFNGTSFAELRRAPLDSFDGRLLNPIANVGAPLRLQEPPRSHVGLDGAVLLVKASSGAALPRRYPWKGISPTEVLRQISLPRQGTAVSAVIRRHHKDRPHAENEKPYALRYMARFDVSVPAFGDRTVAVLHVGPKNRAFGMPHDIHVKLNGCAFRYGLAVPLVQALLAGVAASDSISVHSLDLALDVEAPYGALAAFQNNCLPGVGYFRSVASYGQAGAATGVIYGSPSGRHRVVVYDKLAEIEHRRRHARIIESPGLTRGWIACTRFEYRLFPHRFGTSSSLHDCLTTMPKVWSLWGVADMRQFAGACPALMYLAAVREFGHLHTAPTVSTVLKKVEAEKQRAKPGRHSLAPTTLSASERVLYTRYQRRSPDWASAQEARIFHENASTALERSASRTTFRIGELIEAQLPEVQQQLRDAGRIALAPA